MTISNKISNIFNIINEIRQEDEGVANILTEGFGLSLNILQEIAKNPEKETFDISEQLEIVANIMGFNLEELVEEVLKQRFANSTQQCDTGQCNTQGTGDGICQTCGGTCGTGQETLSDKNADESTLDFITGGSQVGFSNFPKQNIKDTVEFATADLEEYEKFLVETKLKENISELDKLI